MAGPIFLDRVAQVTTASGVLTTFTLGDVVVGYKPFSQAGLLDVGDTFYCIVRHVNPVLNEWQVFEGTLASSTTITVGAIGSSSEDDNSAVTFSAGNKYAILDASAEFLMDIAAGFIGIVPRDRGGTGVDLSATGGVRNVLKQAADGTISSAALLEADIPTLTAYSTPASTTSAINTALTPYSTTSQINAALANYLLISTAASTYSTPAAVTAAIATPTITTFANALHTHTNAAGGGTLTTAAIASGTFANSFIPWASPSAIGTSTPAAGTFLAIAGTTGAFSDTVTGTRNALGVTPADGVLLTNTTAAAAGAQQISPSSHWRGQGWKTDATAASQLVDWQAYVLPVEGTANPTSQWLLRSSINGGAYTTIMTADSRGYIGIGISPITPLNVFSSGATGPARVQHNSASDGGTLMSLVGGTMTGTHYLLNASGNASGDAVYRVQNANTTSGADATFVALLTGAGNVAGDARIQFAISGAQTWTAGLDQSDSSRFKISSSSDLGTSDRMKIDPTTGLVTIGSLRIDQTPVAATPTPTHTIIINLNGTDYRVPCVI